MSIYVLRWPLCCGWRSHWCLLDVALRCKVPPVCRAHDRAITAWIKL